MVALSVGPLPSVRPSISQSVYYTSSLDTSNPKYFLPLSVSYSVIADNRWSCRSSRPHAFFLAREPITYTDYIVNPRCS